MEMQRLVNQNLSKLIVKGSAIYHTDGYENETDPDKIGWSRELIDKIGLVIATQTSLGSKDPDTRVGSCVATENYCISGCNQQLANIDGEILDLPNERNDSWVDSKYPYVVHAEQTTLLGLLSSGFLTRFPSCKDVTLYINLFTCNECAKLAVISGVKRVVFMDSSRMDRDYSIAGKRILEAAGIEIVEYTEQDLFDAIPEINHMLARQGVMDEAEKNALETIKSSLAID